MRKYPVQSSATFRSIDNVDMPLSLIAGCKITSQLGMLNVFISKVYVKGTMLNIALSYLSETDQLLSLGYFNANITEDYQVIPMTAFVPSVSGTLIVGNLSAMATIQGCHQFTQEAGQLEYSCVTCIQLPTLLSIVVDGTKITGDITLATENITKTVEDALFSLSVTRNTLVTSNNDTHSNRLNCPTSVITGINSVEPDSNGNIDVFGISPVVVTVSAEGITVDVEGLEFEDVCKNVQNIIPPIPVNDPDTYPNFLDTENPEWQTWPKFESSWSDFI